MESSWEETVSCPCCSDALLRHFRGGKLYYFCQHCRSEVEFHASDFQDWIPYQIQPELLLTAKVSQLSSIASKSSNESSQWVRVKSA